MDVLLQELAGEFGDVAHIFRVMTRLVIAALIGGIIGLERLRDGRAAGLRTHMLVALGSALFTLTPLEGGMKSSDLSRVIQGIAAGIGFLGAGNIVKLSDQHRVEGLTTAASIWLTAAAGMAVGAGWLWPAIFGVFLAWLILAKLRNFEHHFRESNGPAPPSP